MRIRTCQGLGRSARRIQKKSRRRQAGKTKILTATMPSCRPQTTKRRSARRRGRVWMITPTTTSTTAWAAQERSNRGVLPLILLRPRPRHTARTRRRPRRRRQAQYPPLPPYTHPLGRSPLLVGAFRMSWCGTVQAKYTTCAAVGLVNFLRGGQLGLGFGLVFGTYESVQSGLWREPRLMFGAVAGPSGARSCAGSSL